MRDLTLIFNRKTLLFFLPGLFLISCKKDTCNDPTNPKCGNYVACTVKTGADAGFKIYENVGSIAFEADTVWVNSPLILWAQNKPGTKFSWRIRTTGYSFTSTDSMATIFSASLVPPVPAAQFYTVTCIASKDVGTCKDLKSIDSASKVFYMWPKEYGATFSTNTIYLPVFGTYAGYKKSRPGELVYVTVFDTVLTPPNLPCNFQLAGMTSFYNIIRNLAYNHFSSENFTLANGGTISSEGASAFILQSFGQGFYNKTGCYGSRYLIDYSGFGRLDLNNSKLIAIYYTYWDTITRLPVDDYFSGFKVN